MSGLKIGLVTSVNDESEKLVSLLNSKAVEVVFNILPSEISDEHVNSEKPHVWLLKVDDESWDDAVDHLLDESEVPVYFTEPGTLLKQSHPEFWVANLIERLFEITGLPKDVVESTVSTQAETSGEKSIEVEPAPVEPVPVKEESAEALDKNIEELELSTVGLPSDIAAELVSELEDISPVLSTDSIERESEQLDDTDLSENVLESPQLKNDAIEEIEEIDSIQESEASIDNDFSSKVEPNLDIDEDINIELADFGDEVSEFSIAEEQSERVQEPQSAEEIQSLEDDDELSMEGLELDISLGEELQTQFESSDSDELTLSLDEPEEELILEEEEQSSISIEPSPQISDQEELSFELEMLEDEVESEEDTPPAPQGKASFNIDDPEQVEAVQTSDVELIEEDDSGLSLETLEEEEVISGKAVFIEDVDEQAEESNQEFEEEAESLGLSLEPIDSNEKPITGKANFLDESFHEEGAELEERLHKEGEQASLGEQDSADKLNIRVQPVDVVQEEEGALSLEAIEEEKADWLRSEEEVEEIDSVNEFEVQEEEELEIESVPDFELDPMTHSGQDESSQIPEEIALEAEHHSISEQSTKIEEQLDISPEVVSEVATQALNDEPIDDHSEFSIDDNQQSRDVDNDETINSEINDTEFVNMEEVNAEVINTEIGEASSIIEEYDSDDFAFDIPMLDETASGIEFDESPAEVVQAPSKAPCWVIGASLGGPAAVKRFMHALPANVNASFVVAQHIDENFLPVLAEILTSNSQFDVEVANGSNDMSPGKVLLAPLKGKTVFLQDGSMLVDRSQKWSGPYSPCINDVIEEVGAAYGSISGAIIFSGMGDDGLVGAKKMREAGGQVWAQSIETCANSSMPESVINAGEVDFVGSPEELAEQLVKYLNS